MSLAHWDCHSPSACGCVGSEDGASKQDTVTIYCYFNKHFQIEYMFVSFVRLHENEAKWKRLPTYTFRDGKFRRLPQPFQHTDDRSQSPMTFLLLQHTMHFTFKGETNDAVSPC
jgi:hypothetical protein